MYLRRDIEVIINKVIFYFKGQPTQTMAEHLQSQYNLKKCWIIIKV